MPIWLRLTLTILVIAACAVFAAISHVRGWWLPAREPEAISAILRPHDHVFVPEGEGPFPTVLTIHGCGGLHSGLVAATGRLRDWGYAAIAVDSMAGRGLTVGNDSELCSGSRVLGPERAGDVLVSLADAREMPFVDRDRIALIGYSHGGWTLMELLNFAPPEGLPPGLTRNPEGGLQGVRGVALYYPYCGRMSFGKAWRPHIPTLFMLGENDALADPRPCLEAAGAMRAAGHPIVSHLFPGAGHGFDGRGDGPDPHPGYHPASAAASLEILREFLGEVLRGG